MCTPEFADATAQKRREKRREEPPTYIPAVQIKLRATQIIG